MRLPITKYGLPQVAVYPVINLLLMLVLLLVLRKNVPAWAIVSIEVMLFAVLVWQFSFFRDPHRVVPEGEGFLISPADGVVSDVGIVDDAEHIDGPAVRIGIFLSVFNVHINRMPADVRIDGKKYRKGRYINAMKAESSKVNESNDVYMTMTGGPGARLVVRQISGAIARRIVCAANEGDVYQIGQKFGMIKYGSRTELYFPVNMGIEPCVKPGDKVSAGLTKVAEYERSK
ncbi:phosphatidylserine decarboxylase [Limihaloglobus sulfuriphilus]|uniref:Phosphatidylserine decarboxylase n=1 Tax=Limihaloglobus sulfuriphilus TaxID=1851148 RepID=A0A1Q2MEY2_9BACT|nr:phosphatidylserine decarboxylase [Limihaloglobus sulfuriphilus]AQQ71261.1 phosphatidylserine decarboxylase [Limihaloglobus sulfuriphilus]